MKNLDVLEQLPTQHSFRLYLLGFITLGIYYVHYCKNFTKVLNAAVDEDNKTSDDFIKVLMVLAYLNLALYILSKIIGEEGGLTTIASYFQLILSIAWCFMIRNSINTYCELDRNTYMWIEWVWILLFNCLFINFKVNSMVENMKHPEFIKKYGLCGQRQLTCGAFSMLLNSLVLHLAGIIFYMGLNLVVSNVEGLGRYRGFFLNKH